MRKFNETLKVDLTQDEITKASEELAKLTDDIGSKEDAKKAVASQFKAEIDGMSADAKKQAALVRNKYEYRSVKCYEEEDVEHATVSVYREDTGEMIRSRAMTSDELQTRLAIDVGDEDHGDDA